MKIKSILLLAVAIACGLIAMVGVQQVLSQDDGEEVETVPVLMAVTDIMPGIPLDGTNTKFQGWPKEQVPEGAVTSPEEYEERSLRVSAVPNEIIMLAKLGEKGVFGGSSEIPEGMRIGTVQVNLTKTHSGLILPGDRVDVVLTYTLQVPGRGRITKTKTVLQYIKIFATDNVRQSAISSSDTTEINSKNITLLVTPEQYNILMLADDKGQITLALRNGGDDVISLTPDFDETMFEDMFASDGEEDIDYDNLDGEEPQATETGDVREFLATESEGVEEPEFYADVQVAETPTWIIQIYDGDELREEEVELPEELIEEQDLPVPAGTDTSQKKTGLKGLLQSILSGA